jgi:hypothetical protein
MNPFIQINLNGVNMLIATSAIVAIQSRGKVGTLLTLNTPVEGFDPINKAAFLDIPFEDFMHHFSSQSTEITKGDSDHTPFKVL